VLCVLFLLLLLLFAASNTDSGKPAKAKGPVSPRSKPTTQKAPQQFNRPAPTTQKGPQQFNRPIAQGAKQVVPRQFNRPAGGVAPSNDRQIKSARGAAPVRGKFGAAAMPVKLSTAPAEQQIRELKAKYNAEKNVRINAMTKLENAVTQLNEVCCVYVCVCSLCTFCSSSVPFFLCLERRTCYSLLQLLLH
jgi:hypothetical protein